MTPILSATLLRTQSDARLVALVRQGHERAFEAIVERYRRPLHRHVRRVLPEARTEDAIQQTFLKVWSSLQEGAEVRELRPWLYRIAHNTALDALKRAGYDYDELTESLRSPDGPETDLERRTVIRETLAGVAALPFNQREALLRTAVGGDSRAQVAHDLGLTDGAVRQLVHRARATLRAAATAVTPTPIAIWAAGAATSVPPSAARLAELGAAGGAGLLLKGGAVLVAAGVLVTGPVALNDLSKRHTIGADSAAADSSGRPALAARWVVNGGTDGARAGTGGGGSTATGDRRVVDRQPARRGRTGDGSTGSDSSGTSTSGSGEPHTGSDRGAGEGSGGGDDQRSGSGRSGDGGGDRSGSDQSGGSGGNRDGSGSAGSGSGDAPSGEGSGSAGSGSPTPSGNGEQSGSGSGGSSGSSGDGSLGDRPEPPRH